MDSRLLKIVYMGTPEFAVAPLRWLHESGYTVVAVVTAADKPAGRGQKLQQSAVKQYAQQEGLLVLQPEKLRDPEFLEQLRALDSDLGIVIAFRMLPEVVWQEPRLGTFNLHASLLPQYRGAAPINWAIMNGEIQTGVTTFMLNKEIDRGAVLGQLPVAIEPTDSAGSLHDKLMEAGVELVAQTVANIASGSVQPVEQEHMSAVDDLRDAPKIFKEDCLVDWQKTGKQIYNHIRGLSPYPTAWTRFRVGEDGEPIGVKIFVSHCDISHTQHPVGAIVSDGRTFLKVACADGYVWIDELQVAGKRRMTIEEYLRGAQLHEGLIAQ